MPEDEKNPFVRFKQHVDAHIGAGLTNILGLPSFALRNLTPTPFSSSTDMSPTGPRLSGPNTPSSSSSSSAPPPRSPSHSQEEEEAQAHLEARLDQLRGGTYEEHQLAWRLFATRSAYSPLRLADDLGWEPTPNGLPAHVDPEMFGWTDAFEDLLAASSAKPMMSLQERYMRNRADRMWWMWADPAHLWFNRLQQQGLTEVYFPYHEPGYRYRSPQTMQEWVETRKREAAAKSDPFDRLFTQRLSGWDDPKESDRPPSLFGEINKVLKVLGKVLDDEDHDSHKRKDEGGEAGKEGPRTEEDLYSAIQSAYHQSEHSLSNLLKMFTGENAWPTDDAKNVKRSPWNNGEQQKEEKDGEKRDENETVETKRDQWTDEHGYVHAKTEIIKDKDGREYSRETRYTVRPAEPKTDRDEPRTIDTTATHQNDDGKADEEKRAKADGWFWK
ncbi:hypothetical protein QBC46DRAFT_180064 [Diplogelasinospora grovesii]|uniref:Uncharacterized protein n=1 Tax=Diplogelasinospora grovesii TaxID=303347 RepID=A0AAN6S2P2_9PEZI|nr:hypothetical protein QBC46DRAFT_180064 [Diplogelasinospora grovesii]